MGQAKVIDLLGGKKTIRHEIHNRMDFMELGMKGVPKTSLLHLAKYMGLSIKQMAKLLTVTERTIQRYSEERNFNPMVSEQILQIAEVAARGTNVFSSQEKFLSWIKQPNRALSGRTPLSLLGSRFGTEMVLDELGRIEHGVFS